LEKLKPGYQVHTRSKARMNVMWASSPDVLKIPLTKIFARAQENTQHLQVSPSFTPIPNGRQTNNTTQDLINLLAPTVVENAEIKVVMETTTSTSAPPLTGGSSTSVQTKLQNRFETLNNENKITDFKTGIDKKRTIKIENNETQETKSNNSSFVGNTLKVFGQAAKVASKAALVAAASTIVVRLLNDILPERYINVLRTYLSPLLKYLGGLFVVIACVKAILAGALIPFLITAALSYLSCRLACAATNWLYDVTKSAVKSIWNWLTGTSAQVPSVHATHAGMPNSGYLPTGTCVVCQNAKSVVIGTSTERNSQGVPTHRVGQLQWCVPCATEVVRTTNRCSMTRQPLDSIEQLPDINEENKHIPKCSQCVWTDLCEEAGCSRTVDCLTRTSTGLKFRNCSRCTRPENVVPIFRASDIT
jgi:hypothetical protein